MNIEKTKVETVAVVEGYTLTVTKAEAEVLFHALGKANFEDVGRSMDAYDHDSKDVNDRLYKMYCTMYDVIAHNR